MTVSMAVSTALSGMRAMEKRAAAIAQNIAGANAAGYQPRRVALSAVAGGGVATDVAPEPPAWPERMSVDLAGELLALTETQLAYTANVAVLETGLDFWDMLATALGPEDRPGSLGG